MCRNASAILLASESMRLANGLHRLAQGLPYCRGGESVALVTLSGSVAYYIR